MTSSAGSSGLIRLGVAAQALHGVAHGGQVDDGGHAGEVLQQHAAGVKAISRAGSPWGPSRPGPRCRRRSTAAPSSVRSRFSSRIFSENGRAGARPLTRRCVAPQGARCDIRARRLGACGALLIDSAMTTLSSTGGAVASASFERSAMGGAGRGRAHLEPAMASPPAPGSPLPGRCNPADGGHRGRAAGPACCSSPCPRVLDPFFHRSWSCLAHHDGEGSLGFILNRPPPSRWQKSSRAWRSSGAAPARRWPTSAAPCSRSSAPCCSRRRAATATRRRVRRGLPPGSRSPEARRHPLELAVAPPKSFRLLLGYAGWGAASWWRRSCATTG